MQHLPRRSGHERYPIPESAPTYEPSDERSPSQFHSSLADYAEYAFVLVAALMTLWLGAMMVAKSLTLHWTAVPWFIGCWLILAYIALPRMHQFFTALYVPDYFIARTRTADGLLGDPVNLALEGSAADIHAALRRAGWVRADDITLGSSWGIIRSSLFRTSYPEAPVSNLYLFGRPQQFAYQQEVAGSASRRHHIRFWQTPDGWLLPGGHRVSWLAAATFDRAVGLSLFTGQITHKIDADIDRERDYVINTVRHVDPECTVDIIEDFSTAYHDRNGGGDMVLTDGNLPVLDVTGAAERARPSQPNTDEPASASTDAPSQASTNPSPHLSEVIAAVPEALDCDIAELSQSVERTLTRAKNKRLPPWHFLLTGMFLLVMTLLVGLVRATLHLVAPVAPSPDDAREIAIVVIAGIILSIAWVLTCARKRWARVVLMTAAAAYVAWELTVASSEEFGRHADLSTSIAALGMMWSISSDRMREWVTAPARLAADQVDSPHHPST